jgi:oligosaccharide repeat unit polymerase
MENDGLMVVYKIIAIFFSILFLVQAYIIRITAGSYLVPGALFSFVWFIFTIIPLVVLFGVPVNPISILYLLACVFVFSLGAVPFNWKFALEKNKEKEKSVLRKLNSNFIKYSLYFSIILSIIFSFSLVISNGFELVLFLTDFIGTSARYAALRGNEYLEYGLVGALGVFFTYFSAVLSGILSFYKKSGLQTLLAFFVGISPSLFAMLTQSSKLIFFVAVIFYLSSTLLMKIYSNKRYLVSLSDSVKIFWLSLLLSPLLILAFISREGYNDFSNVGEGLGILLPAICSYLFGSVYAFSDFFSFYLGFDSVSKYKIDEFSNGYYTFKSIYDALGGTKVFPPGFYDDFYIYKDMLSTNIYTAFRGLVQDFGPLGTLIFMYFFGLLVHFVFYKILVNRNLWLASSLFIMFFAFIGLSFLISIFTARYVFLITVALYLLLTINGSITRGEDSGKSIS